MNNSVPVLIISNDGHVTKEMHKVIGTQAKLSSAGINGTRVGTQIIYDDNNDRLFADKVVINYNGMDHILEPDTRTVDELLDVFNDMYNLNKKISLDNNLVVQHGRVQVCWSQLIKR